MTWAATAEVERFEEAIAWFKSRFPVTEELLKELGEYAGPRAWTVSGVAQLDMVLSLFESILGAIESGISLQEWQALARPMVIDQWGKRTSFRLERIFRNSVQASYNAGRYAQMTRPEVAAVREYWQFDGIADQRQSDICRGVDGTILHKDDPWWKSHYPPLHHLCRSNVRALRPDQAKKKGISDQGPDTGAQDGFGRTPDIAEQWRPDPNSYPRELWAEFQRKQTHARQANSTHAQPLTACATTREKSTS